MILVLGSFGFVVGRGNVVLRIILRLTMIRWLC